ncbi:hypothetical protein ACFPOB_15905 [Bosea eneae]|uniref:Uncharacterized protein n=1 Tax=Bosea eneae TaxID=151454 RepID=A0ABW0ITL5_9HYPH
MNALTAALDRHLASRGQNVTLRRRIGTGNTFVDLPIRARVSGYGTADLNSGVKVTDSAFIASPTPIVAAGAAWPGAAGGSQWPVIGDWLVVNGRQRAIAQVQPVVIGDAVVRIEGRISG